MTIQQCDCLNYCDETPCPDCRRADTPPAAKPPVARPVLEITLEDRAMLERIADRLAAGEANLYTEARVLYQRLRELLLRLHSVPKETI